MILAFGDFLHLKCVSTPLSAALKALLPPAALHVNLQLEYKQGCRRDCFADTHAINIVDSLQYYMDSTSHDFFIVFL